MRTPDLNDRIDLDALGPRGQELWKRLVDEGLRVGLLKELKFVQRPERIPTTEPVHAFVDFIDVDHNGRTVPVPVAFVSHDGKTYYPLDAARTVNDACQLITDRWPNFKD